MAVKKTATVETPFFNYIWHYYAAHKKAIRKTYTDLTRKLLDFNDPENSSSFLRQPQFEAFEVYVFLKEYLDNPRLSELFDDWRNDQGKFRISECSLTDSLDLFSELVKRDAASYDAAFEVLAALKQDYANYIFALTMGVGKTVLMATCIFYEFLLARKYPQDERFCHNVIVFAPDTTVLQSLKEIQEFDRTKVLPEQYAKSLESIIQFHFLEEAGVTLNTLDSSSYNVVISNTQKIIRKRQKAEQTAAQLLFSSKSWDTVLEQNPDADLYALDDEGLSTNQRFQKLSRLQQLGIFVDEAHHAFGKSLKKDMSDHTTATSLRLTIDLLARDLKQAGTKVVACYNFTGTPYVENQLMPEVVYAYSLHDAIKHRYLKTAKVSKVENAKSLEFIRNAIRTFISEHGQKRYEGYLPKMAIFASTIDELEQELKPQVEAVVAECGLSIDRILVNVGDEKLTTQDDIKEFRSLDTVGSEKQFILLVGKGKEGWNCRSLFSVALFRQPKSKIFVLQATMRCLRSITATQQEGHIFLSAENYGILSDELEANFRVSVEEFASAGKDDKKQKLVRVRKPPVSIEVTERKTLFNVREKKPADGFTFGLHELDISKYKITEQTYMIQKLDGKADSKTDLSYLKEDMEFSALMLVAEIARYLNKSPIEIDRLLRSSAEGMEEILQWVNQSNDILYEVIISRLFHQLYEVDEYKGAPQKVTKLLIKEPPNGEEGYTVKVDEALFVSDDCPEYMKLTDKSFHVSGYAFDSLPELAFFKRHLPVEKIRHIWFTGMFTHGQTEFYVHYIDPETNVLRTYYPDFLIELDDGSFRIVEIKGEHLLDSTVTKAKKAYASEMAQDNKMVYTVIPGNMADRVMGL